ncbi:MAG: GAF domain-containing protein, partial [Marinomonas sp.]
HGCLTIPFSRGVCGAAARLRKVQIVDDVNGFDGHIACSSGTRSELVIPFDDARGVLLGVLDIDSDRPAAFDAADARGLQALLQMLFAVVSEDGKI